MRKQSLIGVLVVLSLGVGRLAGAESCPAFPERGVAIIEALWNPVQAHGDDDARRALTRAIVEQLAYEFPGEGWVWKSADRTRPPSKDGLAKQVGDVLCAWDWQSGSSRRRLVEAGQRGEDITGQYPIVVAGVNHLLTAPTTPTTPTTPAPTGPTVPAIDELQALARRVVSLEGALAALAQMLPELQQVVAQHTADLGKYDLLTERVDATRARVEILEARPQITRCRVSINLGFGRATVLPCTLEE